MSKPDRLIARRDPETNTLHAADGCELTDCVCGVILRVDEPSCYYCHAQRDVDPDTEGS